ncbi:LuxE/PaaK family acyltransferase [Moheibacter sediminis]|uniref:Phenylacetate-coenzyme A ligase PaaK, adenylate-forming domain family n=1 Tax=Moheibacter sediminis TaxID=1434700 RepID=A0A1W1ZN75_9FLAO|nr:acyl transferase [Moheibacter sediminis]SMC49856.1 Phenylacetate-coenzyme A ligase PaaK, adenylate-forming domain family [Moheibacter sediminis]
MISKEEIFSIQNEIEFEKNALKIFHFQAENNYVYKNFLKFLDVNPNEINSLEKIPFLPIRFFKEFEIISKNQTAEKIFTSSGTTGNQTSKHFISDLSFYRESLKHSFKHFYGEISDYTIFALLPSYLEREGSSLIDMVEFWIEESGSGGFYLYNHEELFQNLIEHEKSGKQAILIGVSFALLDFVEKFKLNLKNTIVMETGGMKGRKEEITREELHTILKNGFGSNEIHSEYGMTELLSQAYSKGNSRFETPNWMRILIRDTEDPLSFLSQEKTGGINVIDLANLNSCSFIATDDLGKIHPDNSFEILGRFDNSDVRGCNLMVADV